MSRRRAASARGEGMARFGLGEVRLVTSQEAENARRVVEQNSTSPSDCAELLKALGLAKESD